MEDGGDGEGEGGSAGAVVVVIGALPAPGACVRANGSVPPATAHAPARCACSCNFVTRAACRRLRSSICVNERKGKMENEKMDGKQRSTRKRDSPFLLSTHLLQKFLMQFHHLLLLLLRLPRWCGWWRRDGSSGGQRRGQRRGCLGWRRAGGAVAAAGRLGRLKRRPAAAPGAAAAFRGWNGAREWEACVSVGSGCVCEHFSLPLCREQTHPSLSARRGVASSRGVRVRCSVPGPQKKMKNVTLSRLTRRDWPPAVLSLPAPRRTPSGGRTLSRTPRPGSASCSPHQSNAHCPQSSPPLGRAPGAKAAGERVAGAAPAPTGPPATRRMLLVFSVLCDWRGMACVAGQPHALSAVRVWVCCACEAHKQSCEEKRG